MKKIFKSVFVSLLGVLFFAGASAQKSKAGNSLLWKISKKGNKEASYLFGTVHMICAEDYLWTNSMQTALDNTRQLCLEMNLSDPNLITDASLMMMDLSGGTLRDYFKNEADYMLVANYIKDSLGQELAIAERMKPAALQMMISMGIVSGPCKETVSYELKLVEKAKIKNIEMNGLETLAEQMEVLESIPTDSIINQMIRIAKGEKDSDDDFEKLIAAYKKQDLTTLNKTMEKSMSAGGTDGKIFIDNRNKKWITPMSKMMSEKPTFFAVGAGHIYGLLELLRNAGYTVEAVR